MRAQGAVLASKLLPKGLSRTGQAAFLEALAHAGLERTGTRVRVPVDKQLQDLLARGPAPMTGLLKRLAGVTGPELKRSVTRLAADAAVAVVVRDGKEWMSPPTADQLAAAELESLRACAKRIATLLKWVGTSKKQPARTLDRNDVYAAFELFPRPAAAQPDASRSAPQRVLEALRRIGDPHTGLARVPEVVRSVLGSMTVNAARQALLQLDTDGVIELRPESGIGLLCEEDAALCPRGARDVVLSFARLVDRSQEG